MNISIITNNKKDYLDLLFLADEQENMIDKYLERGDLFALYDNAQLCASPANQNSTLPNATTTNELLIGICVVTNEGDDNYEIQNLAIYPQFQRKGYGRILVNHVCEYYKNKGLTMYVGTSDSPMTVPFYESCGFSFSHRVENYILEHYDEPIFDNGVQLKDKVYFIKSLR